MYQHVLIFFFYKAKIGGKRPGMGGSSSMFNAKTELQSKYKPLNQPDNEVLKQLITAKKDTPLSGKYTVNNFSFDSAEGSISYLQYVLLFPAAVNNELLRRHFLTRTENFLIPLERYFTSLMPLKKYVYYSLSQHIVIITTVV